MTPRLVRTDFAVSGRCARYWLRSAAGSEAAIAVAEDGTVAGLDLAAAIRDTGYGPWTVIRRDGQAVRYLGVIDRSVISQSGARLCDLDRPHGMRFQLLGQVVPTREA